jgi:DNA-directed RNA polymerase specialized sigma subunit
MPAGRLVVKDEQQNVIACHFGYGMSIIETAEIVGKSEVAVEKLKVRMVKALAGKMVPEGAI